MGNNPCIQRHNIHGSHPYPTGRSTLQARGKLALLVPLLALAILLLVPAVVFAEAPAIPEWPEEGAATSGYDPEDGTGDGTMVLTWNGAARATGGYQYRYADSATALLLCPNPPKDPPTIGCQWTDATTSSNATTITIEKGTLTVGTTYWFQVRAVNTNDSPISYSGPSATVSARHRALPPKVEDLVAIEGNAQVTLTWTHLAAYDITSYIIRREGGAGGSVLTTTTEYELNDDETEATYTVSPLVNGIEYSFQVKGDNLLGEGPDFDVGEFVTATPSGLPAAPSELTATAGDGQVTLQWNNSNDDNIDTYQHRYKVNVGGSGWETGTADTEGWEDIDSSGPGTTQHIVTGLTNDTEYHFEVRAIDSDRDEGDRAGPASSVDAIPETATQPPAKMIGVTATVTGVSGGSGGDVEFSWQDPNDNSINKYQYRYDVSSTNPDAWDKDWTDVSSSGASTTQFSLASKPAPAQWGSAATVFFQLRAVNTTDSLNGEVTAVTVTRENTPDSPTTPGAPADLTASAAWSDPNWNVTLSWTGFAAAADTIIDKYQYQQSLNGGDYTGWADIPGGSSATTGAYTFTDVTVGTIYVFKLRGVDTGPEPDVGGVPATSNQVTPGTPSAPTDLKTTDPGGFSGSQIFADFDWVHITETTGVVTGESVSGYQYRYRVEALGSWSDWTDTTYGTDSEGLLPPEVHDNLEGNTKYDFQVRAVDNMGTLADISDDIYGGHSNIFRIITAGGALHVPGAPTGVTAEGGVGLVTITWTAPAVDESESTTEAERRSAAEFYRYQVTTTDPSSVTTAFDSSAEVRIPADDSPTSHTAPGLTTGTYYFRVQAANIRGYGAWSEASAGTTVARVPYDGVWTYSVRFNPSPISPGGTAELQVIATFTPASDDTGGVHTLTALTSGNVSATFAAETPAEVGFVQTGSDTLAHSAQDTVEDSDCSMSSNRLICTIAFNQALRANVSGSFGIKVTPAFSITPIFNGFANVVGTPTSGQLPVATFRVEILSALNRSPEAVGSIGERLLAEGDDPLRIDMKDKFIDPNGDVLKYIPRSSDPKVAGAVMEDTVLVVTPVSSGETTITVIAQDELGLFDDQSFKVTVERARKPGPPDTPDTPDTPVTPEGPVAEGAIGAQSMTEGGASVTINVAGNFSDPNGDELTYTARSSDSSVATVSVDGSIVTVTPVGAGSAIITVTARDPGGEAAIQRFTVTAQGVNLAPVPEGSINVQRSTEGGAAVTNDVAGNFSDANGDELAYTARSSDASVATVSVDGSMVTVTPVGAGTATITVTARDPGGESATQRFTVTVREANLAPEPEGSINGQRLTEGGDAVTIDVAGNFSDGDGDELTYTASSSDEPVATVSLDGSMVTVTTVGAGTATITVIARDPGGKAAIQRFTVTAEEANLAPVPEGSFDGQQLIEGSDSVTIDVAGNFSDANGDELAYTADSSDESVATVSVDGSMVTVTPVGAGTATITVTAGDPGGATAQQNFSADVEAPNEPPQASGTIATDDLVEDGEPARLDVSGSFTDANGDPLTFGAQSSDESVATVSMDGSTVTVTPVGAGTARITVTASDPGVALATQSFTVTVDPAPTPLPPATATPAPPATATPSPATATPPPPATATPPPPATATPPPTLVTLPPPEDGGLPLWAIIVIAVGAISVVVVLVGFVALRMRR